MACEVCLDGIDCQESLPQLHWVRDFVVVAACGSFANAGRELGKAGQSVSASVGLLEKHLEMKLVHRSRRAVNLTDAGRALLPSLQQALRIFSVTVGR